MNSINVCKGVGRPFTRRSTSRARVLARASFDYTSFAKDLSSDGDLNELAKVSAGGVHGMLESKFTGLYSIHQQGSCLGQHPAPQPRVDSSRHDLLCTGSR